MSWNEEKHLTNQQKQSTPINVLPYVPKPNKQQHSKKPSNNLPLIRMPIPQFELDRMNYSDLEDDEDLKTSIGVPQQNSYLINSQQTSVPFKVSGVKSAETQTDDFTFIGDIFSEPKIYEIPVEMEVQESGNFQQTGVQVSEILLQGLLQKLQQPKPAVLTQRHLQMNSAALSMSVENYSFQRSQEFNQKKGSELQINQNDKNDSEQVQEEQQSEELLLEIEPINNSIKQNLFKTANFQHSYTQPDFYTASTPQKSRIQGSQSSPDRNGPMRISETEVNMMHTRHFPSAKIDKEEYEDLQSRFYILEQQNAEKVDQIEEMNKKVKDLAKQLEKSQCMTQQKQSIQQKCKNLQKQMQTKTHQFQKVSQTLYHTEQQLGKLQQSTNYRQHELYDILQGKQKQLQELQNELKSYRDQITSGQEKYTKENEDLENYVTEKQQQISDLKAEYDRKYELYIMSIKEMKEKIQENELKMEKLENLITTKDAKINEYKEDYSKLSEENSILYKRLQNQEHSESNMRQQQGTISISQSHQFSKFANYSFQKSSKNNHLTASNNLLLEEYSHELEKIILTYENVIERQLQTIEELEEKVLEFLKDALTKESEAELLCSQLYQYENNLNGLMVEKLGMELENQRLNKRITESQNKLGMLGSRLIKLAKKNSSLSSHHQEYRNPSSSSSIEDPSHR